MCDLQNLQYFPVNLLTKLPHLRVINMSHNVLLQVPAEIGLMAKLEQLILAHNQLGSIPLQIGQATNLQVLDLSGNSLVVLDAAVGQLAKLRQLLLAHNNLVTLPWPQLCGLWNLELVDVTGNVAMQLDKARTKKPEGDEYMTHMDWSKFARVRHKGEEWLLLKMKL